MTSQAAIHRRLRKKSSDKWIQGAIKHPGVFSSAAHRAGQSTQQYANTVLRPRSKASPKLKRQAALARTLRKMGQRRA